ncbi:MAG: quorum-sensing autoinducer synthase [Alphaproteobacteria bacterium]|nr:quorum-sensing autoinducer synthase [Alphaproteobacteria bacterium]
MKKTQSAVRESDGTLAYNYCQWLYKYRWQVLAFYALVALVAGWQALELRSTMDNRVFFGPENPELKLLTSLEKDYTQTNDVLVAIESKSGDVFTRDGLNAVLELTDRLWKAPFATRVDSLTNFQYSRGDSDEVAIGDLVPKHFSADRVELEKIRSIALGDPLLKGLLVSSKGDVAGVRVNFQFPRDDSASVEKIATYLSDLQASFLTKHPDVQLYFTGNVMVMQAFGEAQQRDIMYLVPLMLIAMAFILYLLLRSWAATLIAMSVAGLSMLIAMGSAGAMGIVLSAGTAPAPFIVLTVALAYGVHLIAEYVDGCRLGASNRVSALGAVESNIFPIFLTSLTTAIGFLSMNASDAPPFHDLGNISAIGVAVAFVLSFSLTPVLLQIFSIPVDPKTSVTHIALREAAKFVNAKPGHVLTAMATVVLVLAVGILHMRQSENWVEYFDETFQFRRDTDAVLQKLTGFDVLEFSVSAKAYGGVEDPKYLAKLQDFTVWLREQPEVLNVVAISDIVKRVNRNVHGDDPAYDRLPLGRDEVAQYLLLYEMSLPHGLSLTDRITASRNASRVTIVVGNHGKNLPSDKLIPLSERFENWLQTHGGPGMAGQGTGLSLMFAHLSERNITLMIGGTSIAIMLVSLILILGLRSVKLAIVSLIGDFVPAVMALGLWGYLVAEMNVAVSIVAAMTFGIVVDDTIHYLSRYARARRILGMTPDQAVEYAFTSTGKAMIFTMTVMCFGFTVLSFSSFGVNATLGMLTVITFGFALVSDFLILAPLLLICDRHYKMFAWHPVRRISGVTENEPLRQRVDAYFTRMVTDDGHLVAGRPPGPGAVQLWSNDYLGLGGHPEIVKAQADVLKTHSEGVFMSAVFLNETSLQRQFEREMAAFVGADATVLCQSGWSANTGLIQALVDERTPVYLDQYAHASLWDGARMARAKVHPFRHNDPVHLEKMIKRYGPGLILVDSVYSAFGTVCPLEAIVAAAEREACTLVVDESHAVGVYGEQGEGLVHALGLAQRVHYRTLSLSKAFATRAGMVAGPARVMEYFPYEAKPAIFSSAVLLHEVAGLSATLKVIKDEAWRRKQLWQNTAYLRRGLQRLGYSVDQSDTQIVALQSGTDAQTRALRDELEERGVFGAVFCAPATPKNHGIIRLSVNARLSEAELDHVIAACAEIAQRKPIKPWPQDLLVPERAAVVANAKSDSVMWPGHGGPLPVAGN